MDKSFVKEMEVALLEEKKRLEGELSSIGKETGKVIDDFDTNFPDYGDKEDENAAEVATFSDSLSLEKTLEGKLHDVLRALDRVKKGTYGKCKYCGEEIDPRRLQARPESGSCVKCKKERLGMGG